MSNFFVEQHMNFIAATFNYYYDIVINLPDCDVVTPQFMEDADDIWGIYMMSKYHKLNEYEQSCYDEFRDKYPDFFNKKYWRFYKNPYIEYNKNFILKPSEYAEYEQTFLNGEHYEPLQYTSHSAIPDCFKSKRSVKRSCDDEYDAKRSRM